MRRAGFSESSTYDKLNAIFESIMGEADPAAPAAPAATTAAPAPTGVETISQFLTKWVKQYMTGTSLGDANSVNHIKSLIKNVEDTYSKDRGKAALTKLANDLYAVSYAQDTEQKAAPSQPTQQPAASPAAAPAAPANNAPSDSWASRVTESKKKPVKYWGQK